MEKKQIYVIGAVFVLLIVYVVTYEELTPVGNYYQIQHNNSASMSVFTQTRHIWDSNLASCRLKALNTLFMSKNNGSVQLNYRMQQAKKCWKESLILYLNYPVDLAYGSHVIPLLASLWATDGAILELGSGWYSTPMVHRI